MVIVFLLVSNSIFTLSVCQYGVSSNKTPVFIYLLQYILHVELRAHLSKILPVSERVVLLLGPAVVHQGSMCNLFIYNICSNICYTSTWTTSYYCMLGHPELIGAP